MFSRSGRPRLLLLLLPAGRVKVKESSLSAIVLRVTGSLGTGTGVPDGGSVVMTGSGPKLGVLLLLAVLLQTVVVTITVLHFTTALNSVSTRTAEVRSVGRTRRRRAAGLLRMAARCAP